jgi:hypothetical protein
MNTFIFNNLFQLNFLRRVSNNKFRGQLNWIKLWRKNGASRWSFLHALRHLSSHQPSKGHFWVSVTDGHQSTPALPTHISFKQNCVLPKHKVLYRYVEALDTEFYSISYRIGLSIFITLFHKLSPSQSDYNFTRASAKDLIFISMEWWQSVSQIYAKFWTQWTECIG